MDGFSICANVITVLQATHAVISICYDFRAALRSSPWSLTRVLDELIELRNILENLERIAVELGGPGRDESKRRPSLDLLCAPQSGPLAGCLRELTHLKDSLSSPVFYGKQGTRRHALMQALGWRLKDNEARSCLERIERCKTTLSLAIAANETTLLLDIRELTASLNESSQKSVTQLTYLVANMHSKEIDEKRQSILRWLGPVGPGESHKSATNCHQHGTSDWLVHSGRFSEWATADRSFIWLSGLPGAGKTILFSNIVTHLTRRVSAASEGSLLAYFYCDFRRIEAREPLNVIGSLLAQLCFQSGFYPADLESAYCMNNTAGQKGKPNYSVFKQALESFSNCYSIILMIDALDECDKRGEVLDFILQIRSSMARIKILITSRQEPEFEDALVQFDKIRLERHRPEMDSDIQHYVNVRLVSDRNLCWLNPSVKADIKERLNQNSAGMFRWAQCQLDSISTLRTVKSIRNALQELPHGLNETYGHILRRVSRSDIEIVRRILLWVSFAVLPLTLEEVHEGIAIEHGMEQLDEESRLSNPQDILSLCGSLIGISDQGFIRLAHLSVKDYFLSQDIRNDESVSTFAMSPSNANQELAINCITYLSYTSLTSGPTPTADLFVSRLTQQPLLRHASTAWPYYPLIPHRFPLLVQVLNADHAFKWDLYPRHATPLYYASSFGLTTIVDALLSSSNSQPATSHSDLNAPGSRFGGTPLHGAVLRFHVPVIRALLAAGAEASRADYNGVSPLHTAATYENEEVVRLLLEYGADAKAVDKGGETPTDWARKAGQEEVVEMLMGSEREGETMAEEEENIAVAALAGVCDARQKNKARQEEVWKRVVPYFPSFYDKRSGLESSVVVSVEIGPTRFDLA